MKLPSHSIQSHLWLYPGKAGWIFLTIPKVEAHAICEDYIWPRRGFGAIPVEVTIGKTTWKTSMFPDKDGSYLLPVKKIVRTTENIDEGDFVNVLIRVAHFS